MQRPHIQGLTWLLAISQAPLPATLCPNQVPSHGDLYPWPEKLPTRKSPSPALPWNPPWSLLPQKGCHTASAGTAAPPRCRRRSPQAYTHPPGAAAPRHCRCLQEMTSWREALPQPPNTLASPSHVRMDKRGAQSTLEQALPQAMPGGWEGNSRQALGCSTDTWGLGTGLLLLKV